MQDDMRTARRRLNCFTELTIMFQHQTTCNQYYQLNKYFKVTQWSSIGNDAKVIRWALLWFSSTYGDVNCKQEKFQTYASTMIWVLWDVINSDFKWGKCSKSLMWIPITKCNLWLCNDKRTTENEIG